MKKLKYLILFIAVVVLLVQPYSINTKVFQDLTENNLASAKEKEDCGCSSGNTNLSLKGYERVKDNKLINSLKDAIKKLNKDGVSEYKQGDFKWQDISKLNFDEETMFGITVPLKNIDINKWKQE